MRFSKEVTQKKTGERTELKLKSEGTSTPKVQGAEQESGQGDRGGSAWEVEGNPCELGVRCQGRRPFKKVEESELRCQKKRPRRQKLVLCGSTQPGVWRSFRPHLCTTPDKITKKGVFSAFELPSSILLIGLRSIKLLDQQSFVNDPFYGFWPQRATSSLRNSALPGFCALAPFSLFSFLLPSPHFLLRLLSPTHCRHCSRFSVHSSVGLVLHSWNNSARLI